MSILATRHLIALFVILICLLAFAGCAPLPQSRGPAPESHTTVLVHNQSLDVLRVYAGSQRVGWVQPGRAECVRIPANYSGSLVLSPVGGRGAQASPLGRWDGHWRLDVGMQLERDVRLNLVPSARCG